MARMQVKLWHPTHFTVVEDSTLGAMSISRWPTRMAAERHLNGLKKNGLSGYILDPESLHPKEK
jgi:hypothetical protein